MSDSNSRPVKRLVTMREVAREAGVHVTTVSLALRNSSQLPETTRLRIQQLARQMGYRPNPLLVSLVHTRRAAHPSRFQGTLGVLMGASFKENPVLKTYCRHLALRAEELGFRLDLFNLRDYVHHPESLQKILDARGITGVIVAPLPDDIREIKLEWQRLAAVAKVVS